VLLSKIPVLDKGYVALLESSNTTNKLREIGSEFFGGEYPPSLEDMGTLTLALKCPIFIQLALSKHQMMIVSTKSEEAEAYVPKPHEIGAKSTEAAAAVAEDIERTTAALLMNPKAYQVDGADKFMSQLITPISVYTTIIVHGTYKQWCGFAYGKKYPVSIEVYAAAVRQVIEAEWKYGG
jgi:hypothetical protein